MKMFIRNKQAVYFTMLFPLFIMVIFGLIGFDKAPQFDVGLVAGTPDARTAGFISSIKGFTTFKVHEGTLPVEMDALKQGDRAVVISIPNDFIAADGQQRELMVYVNEGQQSQSQAIISILGQYLDKTSLQMANVPTYFTISTQVVNSKHLKYIDFLLPGLISMSIMQMAVFSVAFVFVQYKEKGVLKRLLATPMKPLQFVAANTITRLIVSFVQSTLFVVVGVLFLKAHVIGSYGLMSVIIILGSLMFLGLGFTISGIAKTVDSVPVLANLFAFPMMFLGGVFFDINNMPHWLQVFAKFLPLTHLSNAMRDVMTKGAGIGDIGTDLLAMAVWAVVLIAAATYTFSFQEREN
jgi:ABC-2 type transport system permease protein